MKLTPVLHYRHPKYYYYAPKFWWGHKKYKETFHKKWRYEVGINKKLPVEDYVTERKFEVPAGYVIKNPEDFMEELRPKVAFQPLPKERPWPFNTREEPGSRMDPFYKEQLELYFNRKSKLFEGLKGALNFSNTVLESEDSLPDNVMANEDKLKLDDEILDTLERRLKWADELDSRVVRCNNKIEFPKINKWAIPRFGPTLDRKELNVLSTYADCSELLLAKQFGHLYYPRVISPKYVIAFMRENHRWILDLRCDFITLRQNPVEEFLSLQSSTAATDKIYDNLFSEMPEITKTKELIDIKPLNWEINFDTTHFYPDDEELNKPTTITKQSIDTVFLGNNYNMHKPIPDRMMKGKLLLFLYAYAAGRARQLYGNANDFQNESNYQVLPKPITIKGVFGNYSKRNLGFACLQLNTLSYDSEMKNQAWFEGPYDVIEDQELILQRLGLMNLNSYQVLSPPQ